MNQETLIEKYLQQTLSEKDLEVFQHLLQTDPTFKKEVEFQQNVHKVIEAEEDATFKRQLTSFEEKKPSKKSKGYIKWFVAASVALLLGLGYVQFIAQPTNEKLFAENFTPFTNVIQPIVRGDASDDLVTRAFIAYERKEYATAESLFLELAEVQKESYALFYGGVCQLAQGKTEEARVILNRYLQSADTSLATQAQWYIALAHLKENNLENAKDQLQLLMDQDGDFKTQANQLLKEIENSL